VDLDCCKSSPRDRIEKLAVLGHVAICAQRHEIPERAIPLRATLDPVMRLKILERRTSDIAIRPAPAPASLSADIPAVPT
jgi:hypothetical protein